MAQAIGFAEAESREAETTWDFIAPPGRPTGIEAVASRHAELAVIEHQIDHEVYGLYGISDEDRATIEADLREGTLAAEDDEADETDDADESEPVETVWNRADLARGWVSYALGLVMARFEPGVENGLGRGEFSTDVAGSLRKLADKDGVMVLDQGHMDDLAARAFEALRIMLGDSDAKEVVAAATERTGEPEAELRRWLERPFFKLHVQKYRKRPVYWLLQSPGRNYSVWLFHEKLDENTLFTLRGEKYLGTKIRLVEGQAKELRARREKAQRRERRALDRELDEVEEVLADLREFDRRIAAVIERGYVPHIDDGVLINMAPLWELLPAWQAEPKKCWQALERGDYDWSHQAMDHWPDRVREKCRTNRSFAIAHGLE